MALGCGTGYADAQARPGSSYTSGFGVDQDDREAVRWFRLAAEQGGAHAVSLRKRIQLW